MTEDQGAGSMVEKVARALAVEDCCDPDFVDPRGRTQWTYHIPAARAAIAAMREPTEAMKIAAGVSLPPWIEGDASDYEHGGAVYQAAIDAAISESTPDAS